MEDPPQGDDDAEEPHRIEGATILEPVAGMYTDPVLCLDFASLYPSLMRTFTGCVSTHVQDPAAVATETFQVPGTEHHFVTSRVTRGIIPRILDNLTAARQAAKRSMKEATDPQRRALFDSRQLAIKISANSVYGFTGSRRGALAAIPVAESTTAMGRHVIDMTIKYAEEHYGGAAVLYGDSVTGDTCLIIRRGGVIETARIDELVQAEAWAPMTERDGEKQQAWFADGALEVWHEGGFTAVRRVIRHMCAKPLMRVLTHTGVVDCTADHSLVRGTGETASPMEVRIGDDLLHAGDAPLVKLLCEDTSHHDVIGVEEAFAMGLFAADGSCGKYDSKWGVKYSWAINNKDVALLLRAGEHLPFNSRILDTLQSSGVYKLVPVGGLREPTTRYRALFYNHHSEKRIPAALLTAPLDVVLAFWHGFYAGDGDRMGRLRQRCTRIDQKGKEMVAGLWLLGRRLGYKVSLNDRADKTNVLRLTFSNQEESIKSTFRRQASHIKKLRKLEATKSFVYDLETESHHFHEIGRAHV